MLSNKAQGQRRGRENEDLRVLPCTRQLGQKIGKCAKSEREKCLACGGGPGVTNELCIDVCAVVFKVVRLQMVHRIPIMHFGGNCQGAKVISLPSTLT